jgi:protein TonB
MSTAMTYALSRPTTAQRSGLLGIVIAAHVGIILIILAAKTVAPQIMEMPMIVDLLQPPPVHKEPEPKPLPVVKPQPVRQQPKPLQQTPLIEATASTAPAPAAPVASPPDTRPSPPIENVVTQARFDADYLRNPAPPYPPLAKRMGEQGKVVLRVSVNTQGTADSVEVKASSGSQRLDDSAVNTVRTWKFIPARRGDLPVQSWVLVPIIFKLEQ